MAVVHIDCGGRLFADDPSGPSGFAGRLLWLDEDGDRISLVSEVALVTTAATHRVLAIPPSRSILESSLILLVFILLFLICWHMCVCVLCFK